MRPTIATIEIGFGTTTIVKAEGCDYEIRTFPSIPVKINTDVKLGEGVLDSRRVITVEVDGLTYEVGEDVACSLASRSFRQLSAEGFIESVRYKTLLLGSLKMIGVEHIDVLVLGLPVSMLYRKDELINLATGIHDLGEFSVKVDKVLVFEQPLGALLSYIRSGGNDRFKDIQGKNILTVDPGYLTLDWLCTSGLKPNRNRSGACDSGMSKVLSAVAESLKSQFMQNNAFRKMKDINHELVDQAFISGKLKLFGMAMDFPINTEPHFDVNSAINAITTDAVSTVVNNVGDGQDLDLILISGGPAAVYFPAVKAAFPYHSIEIVDGTLTAVARGLQTAGEQWLRAALARGDYELQS